jgi:proteasome lid subunit RPN8/RPN11
MEQEPRWIKILSSDVRPPEIDSKLAESRSRPAFSKPYELSGLTRFQCDGESKRAKECNIVFPQSVYRKVMEHLSQETAREHGGFLLGYEFHPSDAATPTVLIEDAVPARYTEGTPVRLTFTTASWRALDDVMDKRCELGRALKRVGWYHSHPNISIFLSHWDLDVCTTFARRRYPIALVVDPVRNLGGFFVGGTKGYEPRSPRGFHELRDEQKESIVAWGNMTRVVPDQKSESLVGQDGNVAPVRDSASKSVRRLAIMVGLAFLILASFSILLFVRQRFMERRLEELASQLAAINRDREQSEIDISPSTSNIFEGQEQTFVASTDVVWSLSPEVGEISATGVYTAPPSVSEAKIVTVSAASKVNPAHSATASVTIVPRPLPMSVSPGHVMLGPSDAQEFTISGLSNDAISWTINPKHGTIQGTRYTAPSSIFKEEIVTITATNRSDPSKSVTATVTLKPSSPTPKPNSQIEATVRVNPAATTLRINEKRRFAAAVTGASNAAVMWSVENDDGGKGIITEDGEYTAPPAITQTTIVAIRATSKADSKKFARAIVTLEP